MYYEQQLLKIIHHKRILIYKLIKFVHIYN